MKKTPANPKPAPMLHSMAGRTSPTQSPWPILLRWRTTAPQESRLAPLAVGNRDANQPRIPTGPADDLTGWRPARSSWCLWRTTPRPGCSAASTRRRRAGHLGQAWRFAFEILTLVGGLEAW